MKDELAMCKGLWVAWSRVTCQIEGAELWQEEQQLLGFGDLRVKRIVNLSASCSVHCPDRTGVAALKEVVAIMQLAF